jgi:hypothetical protein
MAEPITSAPRCNMSGLLRPTAVIRSNEANISGPDIRKVIGFGCEAFSAAIRVSLRAFMNNV